MKKYARYWVPIVILLVLAAFFQFAMIGYRFLPVCFGGAAALILCYMLLRLLSAKHEKAASALRGFLNVCVVIGFLAVFVTEGYVVAERINARPGETRERYAVVLGAGVNGTVPSRALRVRLDTALKFANENPDAVLVLSGGQGAGEDISEARCMFTWLTARGVDASRLILEDRSTSTEENLTFARRVLAELGAKNENATVITGGYHIARARLMAADLGYPSTTARAAYSGYPVLELNYYLREVPAIWWYLLTR